LKKEQKTIIVDQFKSTLEDRPDIFLADLSGINVESVTILRTRFRDVGIGLRVMKNTLLKRAFVGSDYEALAPYLEGPNAVIVSRRDPVAMAKIVVAFNKEFQEKPVKVRAGVLGGRVTGGDRITDLANLPSRDVLLAMTLATMQAPISGFVNVMAGNVRKLLYALTAIKEKKQ
jgi:large subunit ribosomal protein L10